jgi:hypothetical protein
MIICSRSPHLLKLSSDTAPLRGPPAPSSAHEVLTRHQTLSPDVSIHPRVSRQRGPTVRCLALRMTRDVIPSSVLKPASGYVDGMTTRQSVICHPPRIVGGDSDGPQGLDGFLSVCMSTCRDPHESDWYHSSPWGSSTSFLPHCWPIRTLHLVSLGR